MTPFKPSLPQYTQDLIKQFRPIVDRYFVGDTYAREDVHRAIEILLKLHLAVATSTGETERIVYPGRIGVTAALLAIQSSSLPSTAAMFIALVWGMFEYLDWQSAQLDRDIGEVGRNREQWARQTHIEFWHAVSETYRRHVEPEQRRYWSNETVKFNLLARLNGDGQGLAQACQHLLVAPASAEAAPET